MDGLLCRDYQGWRFFPISNDGESRIGLAWLSFSLAALSRKRNLGPARLAPWVKAPAIKPDDLRAPHGRRRDIRSELSSDSHTCTVVCVLIHQLAQINGN